MKRLQDNNSFTCPIQLPWDSDNQEEGERQEEGGRRGEEEWLGWERQGDNEKNLIY